MQRVSLNIYANVCKKPAAAEFRIFAIKLFNRLQTLNFALKIGLSCLLLDFMGLKYNWPFLVLPASHMALAKKFAKLFNQQSFGF